VIVFPDSTLSKQSVHSLGNCETCINNEASRYKIGKGVVFRDKAGLDNITDQDIWHFRIRRDKHLIGRPGIPSGRGGCSSNYAH